MRFDIHDAAFQCLAAWFVEENSGGRGKRLKDALQYYIESLLLM